jgi:aryl-alcohol dehydrogenase-like predicted oxidoreductase
MAAKYYPTRKIGTDDVSAIGFGAMGLGAYYGQTGPDEERFQVKREH